MNSSSTRYEMSDLLRVMVRLRDPQSGCPWDVAQTFQTIVPSTLEECYELAAAIESENFPHVAEELGDVLFQVVFYAQMASEEKLFSFGDIIHTLVDKLLRRHPHVFANGDIEGIVSDSVSVEQATRSWEEIKKAERVAKSQTGVLDDVPAALPALPRAQKLQKRAAAIGFDWAGSAGVFIKLQEEILELQAAMVSQSVECIEDEMGDVLFTCVNLARHLNVDAETSLRRSSMKFEARFKLMEALAADSGVNFATLDEPSLDALWSAAKSELLAAR